MSVAFARSKYRQTESTGAPEVESPYRVILVTLGELDKSLDLLCTAQETNVPFPDTHLNRCFTAIYILQSSLDFETGGALATSLFQVYEYCRLQTLKAFRREENPELAQARTAIQGILSAWEEIGPQVEGAKS